MESMGPARVIFVDDEPTVCSAVAKTLERVGLSVRCFHCAGDCLSHLSAGPCDLLITDVRMPEKDGVDLLCEVKERLPWLPVLLVTGYGDVPLAVRAMKAGAADFIEKPLDRDTFLRTVQSVLAKSAGQAALTDCQLTQAEMKVLCLILDGKNNREIAAVLHRSPRTVEVHRGHLMQKLGAANIIELLRRAADLGLLRPTPRDGEASSVRRGSA
jgi:two-component system, LuxR family, response regulator FixJ